MHAPQHTAMGQTDWKKSAWFVGAAVAGVVAVAWFFARKSPGGGLFTPNASKKRRLSKSQLIDELAAHSDLTRSEVRGVLDAIPEIAKKQLGPRGPGEMVIPGTVKLKTVKKKATKARKGRNPATGEEIRIKAKKASKKVRATPLKPVKEAAKVRARRKAG